MALVRESKGFTPSQRAELRALLSEAVREFDSRAASAVSGCSCGGRSPRAGAIPFWGEIDAGALVSAFGGAVLMAIPGGPKLRGWIERSWS